MNPPRCEDCGALLAEELGWACPACLWGDGGEVAEPVSGLEFGEEIARGGMGIVYRARQREPDREVAVKMLLPHLLEEPGLRERFANEAKVAASLDHPGILPVYAVGDHGGVPYFSMKLADGGTLAARLKMSGTVPAAAAVTLVAELADAIHYAHRRGVLHRDLKPGNILFDGSGRAFVADFGLAKIMDEAGGGADLTRSLELLGTPQYLPPEIARGSLREASTAGDIYALGAVLHEMLAGRPPFEADTVPGLLRRIADEEVKPLANLSRDLQAVLGKCLEKEPARRYATAGELSADLRAWSAGRSVKARSPGVPERLWRWARRSPLAAGLTVSLVALIAVGLVSEVRAKRRLAESLADSLLAQAALVRREIDGGARDRALDLVRKSTEGLAESDPERAARRRSEAAGALALPSLKRVRQWNFPGNWNLTAPAFLPDLGGYLAPDADGGFAVCAAGGRRVWSAAAEKARSGYVAGNFACSAGGETISATYVDVSAHRCVTEVYTVSEDGLQLRGRFESAGVEGAVPVLFRDGRFIVSREGAFLTGYAEDGLKAMELPVAGGSLADGAGSAPGRVMAESLTLSADETRLVAALAEPPGLAVWAVSGDEARLLWQVPLAEVAQCPAWSRDGSRLAFADTGTGPVSLVIADSRDGKELATLPGHGKAVTRLAFHPDGQSVASVGFDNWIVWQSITPGGFRVRLPGNAGPLVFSADGMQLGYSSGRGSLAVAEVALPVGWRSWADGGGAGTVTCVQASRDGSRLAVARMDGLALWDARAGRRLDFRKWSSPLVRWPWFRFAADGTFLVSSDTNMPVTRWPVRADGFGEAEERMATGGGVRIIHDFTADGRDWLVSADREQRENSSFANFYRWPGGDPARARIVAARARANGLTFLQPACRFAVSYHSNENGVAIWDCASAEVIHTLPHPEPVFLAVSPDGRRLCSIGSAEGRLWDPVDWSEVARWSQDAQGKSVPAFSADGRFVATTNPSGVVTIRRARDGGLWLELAPPRELSGPEIHWLGNDRLVLASGSEGLHEWDLSALEAAARLAGIPW